VRLLRTVGFDIWRSAPIRWGSSRTLAPFRGELLRGHAEIGQIYLAASARTWRLR